MASPWHWNDHDSTEDGEIPEPIYLQLDTKLYASRNRDNNYESGSESDSEGEEISGDDVGFDLSAPPPESWFHGRISRQTAISRLQNRPNPGTYLIRESEAKPGDYAISYLSKSGHVHHFRINSNCGDYYIGGRQFYSLKDLIGFYTNCSFILQNESLEAPVVPPRPVPLYTMLRATQPHMKTPGTDELNVSSGEVFQLLSRLNDDWGWGRSQRSDEGGLIPLAIMDDVTDEDPNLGRPWFHEGISKDEVMHLLKEKGEPGSFIVRLSATPEGSSGTTRYSLAVRTADRVQRFLINKDSCGFYYFGGRHFNSLDEVIERYHNEAILEGLRLKNPIPLDSNEARVPDVPVIPARQNRSDSLFVTKMDMPGDKKGKMLLRKGKKSPVHTKWKEFFFVLRFGEHKLLYFENENSHRSKGLLDLKQCRVYAVHPSLYGRDDCFVVMICYLNERFFHYICAQSAEAAQEWISLLKQCTETSSHNQQQHGDPRVQQIRSLSLSLRDCKLAKAQSTQVSCLVDVDGACIARTKKAPEMPYVFDEIYFIDLPPYAENFGIELNGKGGLLKAADISIGRVSVFLSDLPNSQEDDKWHQLLPNTKSAVAKGSLRMVTTFKHEVILPLEEYKELKELILSDDLVVIETLASVCKDHHAELASTLINIFCHYERVIPILGACLAKSVEREDMPTLFRSSSLSTMLMDQFMKLSGIKYLHHILKEPIQRIMELQKSCELNPASLPKGTDIMQNLERLEFHLSDMLNSIFTSVDHCPGNLRITFRLLQEKVIAKWPTSETVRTRAVSGFLFLRFICPALLKPQLFNLVTENPSPIADRTLKLVAKGIQNLANMVEFKAKEPFMTSLNPYIQRIMPQMRNFIDELSKYSSEPSHVYLDPVDPARDLATIAHLSRTYEKGISDLVGKTTKPGGKEEAKQVSIRNSPIRKLENTIRSLRQKEKHYLF